MYRRPKKMFFPYCNVVVILHLFQNMMNSLHKLIRSFTECLVAFLEIFSNVFYHKKVWNMLLKLFLLNHLCKREVLVLMKLSKVSEQPKTFVWTAGGLLGRQDPPLALCTKDTLPELPSGTDTLLHQQHPQALPSNLAKYFLTSRFVWWRRLNTARHAPQSSPIHSSAGKLQT